MKKPGGGTCTAGLRGGRDPPDPEKGEPRREVRPPYKVKTRRSPRRSTGGGFAYEWFPALGVMLCARRNVEQTERLDHRRVAARPEGHEQVPLTGRTAVRAVVRKELDRGPDAIHDDELREVAVHHGVVVRRGGRLDRSVHVRVLVPGLPEKPGRGLPKLGELESTVRGLHLPVHVRRRDVAHERSVRAEPRR